QRALQLFQVVAGDAGRGQQAEAGVDAVGRTALGDDVLDAGDAGVDGRVGRRVQSQVHGRLVGGAQVGQGQLAGFQVQGVHRVFFHDWFGSRARPDDDANGRPRAAVNRLGRRQA